MANNRIPPVTVGEDILKLIGERLEVINEARCEAGKSKYGVADYVRSLIEQDLQQAGHDVHIVVEWGGRRPYS